ncbi:MAG: hypothetical protein J0I06_18470 [Planctomycetes bacterium]|nr:hypothetical protein [Planctomycetota bacterium]
MTVYVDGEFQWLDQDVGTGKGESSIRIGSSGVFTCKSEGSTFGTMGGLGAFGTLPSSPDYLEINNQGTVFVESDATITLDANFTNAGKVIVNKGTLELLGAAEQEGSDTSTFQILNNSRVILNTQNQSNILGIRQGTILGNGAIGGNLSLGKGPNMAGATTAPIISPGDPTNPIGTLRVTGNFKMFSGEMKIDVSDATKHDTVSVDGFAQLGAVQPQPGGQPRPGGTIVGTLLQGDEIAAGTQIDFLERADSANNSPFSSVVGLGTPNSGWEYGINATKAWYRW